MTGRFFQFPLCALSFPASEQDRLDQIVSFCCLEVGRRRWERFSQREKDLRRQDPLGRISCICEMDLTNEAHQQAVAGAELLEINPGGIRSLVASHERLADFVREFEQKHGADARVRLASKLVFEARDHKGISYVELVVLCAIFSKIGANKAPVRITRDEIWRRALGYKSEAVFRVEAGDHLFKLTKRLVRSTIDRLHNRKFFARITFARRGTYYSHRMNSKALADHIFTTKIQRSLARQARLHADADLTKRIQAERHKLAGLDATEGATESPP
jgi:hypothetical protein